MSLPTPLVNRTRAEAVMQSYGVSAMVLADPTNVYYATGFWPQVLVMGHLGSSIAVVPADATQPVTLITAQFLHYFFDLDDTPPGSPLQIKLYTAPDQDSENAVPPQFFRSAEDGAGPDPYERATRATTLSHLEAHPAFASARLALKAVLGGVGGRVATDTKVADWLLGAEAKPLDADPILRRTRMIKSAHEVGLMRTAAQTNCEAIRAALGSVAIGDSYADLRNAFFAETGKRGGKPVFLSTDHSASRLRNGVITDGRAFSIDAVASYDGYHGDYGRTVLVGEPQPALRRAVDAAILCNDAVARSLGPGLHFSDVVRIGQEAVAKAGYNITTPSSRTAWGCSTPTKPSRTMRPPSSRTIT